MRIRNLLVSVVTITVTGTAFGYVATQAYAGGMQGGAEIPIEKPAPVQGDDSIAAPGGSTGNAATPLPAPEQETPDDVDVWPRAADEWQGMLVDRETASCESTGLCQSALACVNGRCGPCTDSSQCQAGEVCAMDHCVLKELVTCSSRRDCPDGELCVLSGYSEDIRGNGDMRAWCSGSVPNRAQLPVEPAPDDFVPEPTPISRLLDALLRDIAKAP